jgi:glutathione S-transferase
MNGEAGHATLYVLGISHYCERARWALEAGGIAFREVAWTLGFHARRARRLAPTSALPILQLPDGRVVQGSGAICDLCALPGGDPPLEAHLEDVLGDLVRRFIYAATLPDPRSGVREALLAGAPRGEALALRLAWPVLRRLMQRGLRASPADLAPVQAALQAELDALARRLAGRPHLVGGAFGRADLTAAALLAPLAAPPEGPAYGGVVLAGAAGEALAAWRRHDALLWARAIYAAHRR